MNKKTKGFLMSTLHIWTDGSCLGEPTSTEARPGGFGWVLTRSTDGINHTDSKGDILQQGYGGSADTTNNREEIKAVIDALNTVDKSDNIVIHSDSNYVVKAHNDHWLQNWQANGWKKANKAPVENVDLWQALLEAEERQGQVSYAWVKGHSGNYMNEVCDQLAKKGAEEASKPQLDARRLCALEGVKIAAAGVQIDEPSIVIPLSSLPEF